MEQLPVVSSTGGAPRMPRVAHHVVLAVTLVALVAALLGVIFLAIVSRNGTALPTAERLRLLERNGLPSDFPVHPGARRMSQSKRGGFSYSLSAPVPDVVFWQRLMLAQSGYDVFSDDVLEQDEFFPRLIYFSSSEGTSGAVIIRPTGRDVTRGTEVKVLSQGDPRLASPAVLPGTK